MPVIEDLRDEHLQDIPHNDINIQHRPMLFKKRILPKCQNNIKKMQRKIKEPRRHFEIRKETQRKIYQVERIWELGRTSKENQGVREEFGTRK